jgi:hypothetical protein
MKDSAVFKEPRQSPDLELDRASESGEAADINADELREYEGLESQYVRAFCRVTFLNNLLRFRRSADAQLCEQLEDAMWERAAKFFGISGYKNSSAKTYIRYPEYLSRCFIGSGFAYSSAYYSMPGPMVASALSLAMR